MPNTNTPSKGLLDGAKEKEALRLSKRKEYNLLVRELCDSDLPALLKLCLGNPQYYAYLGEGPTIESLAAEMGELPPGCAPDRKSCLGFFDVEGALVAVLDLVCGYPVERCAFIGFFMVDASRQGVGLGSRLITRLLERLHSEGFVRVRLAYVKGNEQSRRFWERCGFTVSGIPTEHRAFAVVPMERALP